MPLVVYILDYVSAHIDAGIAYRASDMILDAKSDASYISAPNARSRSGEIHYFKEASVRQNIDPVSPPLRNGVIHVIYKITCFVPSSAMEAQVYASFEAAQDACSICSTCAEPGHPQSPTSIIVDNTVAFGFRTE